LDYSIIRKYFPQIDTVAEHQFKQLKDIYSCWNERINVISRKDINCLYERHVLHSLSIAKIVSFLPGAEALDVGTGGGFPSVPLAIMFPETKFTAIDSVGKKIKVLENVCSELNINNIKTVHGRAENMHEKFDFIAGRAVTNLSDFYTWINGKIKKKSKHALPNGIICLKGGNLDSEINCMLKKHSISPSQIIEYNISDFFDEGFFETKKILYIQS
jgi:16S rRNA (guanine527-N7)-methyltransferase